MDRTWVVVNTHPAKEMLAIENLRRQKFETYCPLMRKRIRHARREHEALRPLFPSYVFAKLDPKMNRWRSIASTFGVKQLIAFGERPGLLHSDFIESLKAREVEGVIVRPREPYQVGQKVLLTGGAFEGISATIIELNENDRVVVLMEILSRSVKIKVDSKKMFAS
jgi:transcriptional antiterminator RfaH